jgi:hypothetical protein
MNWYKNKNLKKLFLETTEWNVAWKLKKDACYNAIKNPDGYWLADSLIVSRENNTYLFVEAFEKKTRLGRLGVLSFDGDDFSNFRIVLEENYHLSYPYVFEYMGRYYMIPESSGNNTMDIYEAEEFPYKWNKIKTLARGQYVDTTVIQEEGAFFKFFSYDMEHYKMIKGMLNMDTLEISQLIEQDDYVYERRAGGNVFSENGIFYRAVQNNKYFYGQSLAILNCETDEKIGEILPGNIKTASNKQYRRIHTYSRSGEFEAIDVSDYRFDLFKIIKKLRSK